MNLTYKSISFYSHKGGVGKSFLTYETACQLCTYGRNVFVVDADTQLNLTAQLLDNTSHNGLDNTKIDNLLVQKTHITINERSYDTFYRYLQDATKLFDPGDFLTHPDIPNLKFLIGSPLLSELESQLANSIDGNMPALRDLKLLVRRLIISISSLDPNNVILFDLSPGSSLINQNILLSTDYLITAQTPDVNSLVSLNLLYRYIPLWTIHHRYFSHQIKLLCSVSNRCKRSGNGIAGADMRFVIQFETLTARFVENNPAHTVPLTCSLRIQDGMAIVKNANLQNVSIMIVRFGGQDIQKTQEFRDELSQIVQITHNVI
jgi:cellulose biosynthesis protein BcsQ